MKVLSTKELFESGKCPVCPRTHKVWPATQHDDAVMDACTGLIWLGDYDRLMAEKADDDFAAKLGSPRNPVLATV